MTLYRGTLTRLIRMRNTHDGGPRWKVHFTVETGVLTIELETKPDSTLASEITPDWQGRYVEAEIENAMLLKVTEIPPTREQEFGAAPMAEAYAIAAREITRLDERINEVVTLHASYHKAMVADRHGAERQQLVCDGCGNKWPCDTYDLLTKDYD